MFAGELKIAWRDVDAGDKLEQLGEMYRDATGAAAEFEAMSFGSSRPLRARKLFRWETVVRPEAKKASTALASRVFSLKASFVLTDQ